MSESEGKGVIAEKKYNNVVKKGVSEGKQLRLEVYSFLINLISFSLVIALTVYAFNINIPPEIIPVDDKGSYFEKVPLDEANKSDKEVKQWVVDTLTETFTYTYRNMSKKPMIVSDKYDPEALSYIDKFINSSNLSTRLQRNFGLIEFIPDDSVELANGKLGERLGWQAKTRGALIMYINGRPTRIGRYDIVVTLVREDVSVTKDGIIIKKIQMKEI